MLAFGYAVGIAAGFGEAVSVFLGGGLGETAFYGRGYTLSIEIISSFFRTDALVFSSVGS